MGEGLSCSGAIDGQRRVTALETQRTLLIPTLATRERLEELRGDTRVQIEQLRGETST